MRAQGTEFNVAFGRAPFFLRGEQRNVDAWMDELGLPRDASRLEVPKKMGWVDAQNNSGIDDLFSQAGIPREDCRDARIRGQISDTMDSHRLAWYAETVGKQEAVWDALSRKYFQGKTDQPRIRLADRALLMEVAAEAGLDAAETTRVLDDQSAYRQEIKSVVQKMQSQGINSIPVFIFTIGSGADKRQLLHHGSGNKDEFMKVLRAVQRATHSSAP